MTMRIKGDVGAIYLARKRRKVQLTVANDGTRVSIRLDDKARERLLRLLSKLDAEYRQTNCATDEDDLP